MTSGPLRPSDLVERWHPGARVTMHTNALAQLSSANAVGWFDDELIAGQVIATLSEENDAARFSVVVFRPTEPPSAHDGIGRILATLRALAIGRHVGPLGAIWAIAFGVVASISFDGGHALAVATTVTVLIGAFGAAPIARTWHDPDRATPVGRRHRAPGGYCDEPGRSRGSRRSLTMVTVLADDRSTAHSAIERWWNVATMCAIVDDRGHLC